MKKTCEHKMIKNIASDQVGDAVLITQKCLNCGCIRYVYKGKHTSEGAWRLHPASKYDK